MTNIERFRGREVVDLFPEAVCTGVREFRNRSYGRFTLKFIQITLNRVKCIIKLNQSNFHDFSDEVYNFIVLAFQYCVRY